MPGITRSIAIAGLALMLAVPVLGRDAPERTKPTPLEGSTLTWCADVEPVAVDAGAFRDSPVYVGNEQPMRKVLKWARKQPGYEDVWIDRDHFGWLVLAFSRDADLRQQELTKRFPDDGVVAVEVEHTTKRLRKLQNRLTRQLPQIVDSFAVGVDVTANVTEVSVPYVSEEVVAELEERFPGEPFCLDGGDPADQPVAGPQPSEGEGWSLVGYEHMDARGKNYRTGVAADAKGYRRLWERTGLKGAPAEVDFEQDVVLWFAVGHGSACPNMRLDDIVVDQESPAVYPAIVDVDGNVACTDDLAGVYQFVVALDRERLPGGPFVVGLSAPDGYGVGRDQTVVEIDLSEPGASANKGDIHPAVAAGKEPPARSGTFVEPYGAWDYLIDTTCGIGYLGVLNDIHWITDEADLPDAWGPSVEPDGGLLVSIAIVEAPDAHVDATLDGHTIRYLPAAVAPPPCEP